MKLLSGNPRYNELNFWLLTELMVRIRKNLREAGIDEESLDDLADEICGTIADTLDGTYTVELPLLDAQPFIGYFKTRESVRYIGPDSASTPMIMFASEAAAQAIHDERG